MVLLVELKNSVWFVVSSMGWVTDSLIWLLISINLIDDSVDWDAGSVCRILLLMIVLLFHKAC